MEDRKDVEEKGVAGRGRGEGNKRGGREASI